ncbi:MAG: MFS transporter [Thermoanaerobaculia bacterium]
MSDSKFSSLPVRKREIFGWAMFDFANSSYTTVIVTVAFSIYFTKMVAPGGKADWLWGVAITISNLIVILLAPVMGAISDDSGRKKIFLFGTYVMCVLGTASLYWVLPGSIWLGVFLFVISNVAYSLGENFAAAFLPELSTPENIGRISGFGWGLGYLGGLGCLLLVLPRVSAGFTPENLPNLRLTWLLTAAFFLVAGLPTFLLMRERAEQGPKRTLVAYARVGFSRLATSAHAFKHFSELGRFLAIFFVYSCGLMSVIAFAAIFAERNLGFSAKDLMILFIVLQLSSAVGAMGFGVMQDRLGAKVTIQLTLVLWLVLSVSTYLCTSKSVFWVISLAAGLGIGSLQAASRALVGLFSPLSKAGEFFGFWGLASRAAYALGPLVFGLVSSVSGSQHLALLVNGGFFLFGLWLMQYVDEKAGYQAARSWREEFQQS